jgi:hypothetical protein
MRDNKSHFFIISTQFSQRFGSTKGIISKLWKAKVTMRESVPTKVDVTHESMQFQQQSSHT